MRLAFRVNGTVMTEPIDKNLALIIMRFACWITEAADTHSEYVTFVAFLWQQWLRESSLLLRYTHIAHTYNSCQWAVIVYPQNFLT